MNYYFVLYVFVTFVLLMYISSGITVMLVIEHVYFKYFFQMQMQKLSFLSPTHYDFRTESKSGFQSSVSHGNKVCIKSSEFAFKETSPSQLCTFFFTFESVTISQIIKCNVKIKNINLKFTEMNYSVDQHKDSQSGSFYWFVIKKTSILLFELLKFVSLCCLSGQISLIILVALNAVFPEPVL